MIWNSTSHLSQLIKSVTVLQTVRLCQESHHETSFIEDSKRNVGVFFFFSNLKLTCESSSSALEQDSSWKKSCTALPTVVTFPHSSRIIKALMISVVERF